MVRLFTGWLIIGFMAMPTQAQSQEKIQEFKNAYIINLAEFMFSAAQGSEHDMQVEVLLKGRSNGFLTFAGEFDLGWHNGKTPINALANEDLIIHGNILEAALATGGIVANDRKGHDLVIRLRRYRGVVDKTHLEVFIPLDAFPDNGVNRVTAGSRNKGNYIVADLEATDAFIRSDGRYRFRF